MCASCLLDAECGMKSFSLAIDFPVAWIYTSGGTKFMLFETFTKHHPRSTVDQILKSFLLIRL